MEAAVTAERSTRELLGIARLENDPFRAETLKAVAQKEATGGSHKTVGQMTAELNNQGITAFVDKRGREWGLNEYANMAARTTARQAQVAALLTEDDSHDLYRIVKIGTTCPICAPLEDRVYSKSGRDPDYPALSLAFGKVDPAGPNDLTNTYLNIHPNCLHSIVKYTTIGKTDKQIQRDKDFSNPEKNPLDVDPRSKRQIEEYRKKTAARQQLLSDKKQHQAYREVLGNEVPKDFAKFQELKYNKSDEWEYTKGLKKYIEKYPISDKRFYDIDLELKRMGFKKMGVPLPTVPKRAFILPEGRRDPAHIMSRMLERNISDDDVRSFMTNSKCMFTQWGGSRQAFYSDAGVSVITKSGDSWIFKTAWTKADYDEDTIKILEVIDKHVK